MKGIRRNEVCRVDVEERGGKLVKFLESWATKEREDKRKRRRVSESERKSRRKMERRGDGCVPRVMVCWWPAKTGWKGKWKKSCCRYCAAAAADVVVIV